MHQKGWFLFGTQEVGAEEPYEENLHVRVCALEKKESIES